MEIEDLDITRTHLTDDEVLRLERMLSLLYDDPQKRKSKKVYWTPGEFEPVGTPAYISRYSDDPDIRILEFASKRKIGIVNFGGFEAYACRGKQRSQK